MEFKFGERMKGGAKKAWEWVDDLGEHAADKAAGAAEVKEAKKVKEAIVDTEAWKAFDLLRKKYEEKRKAELKEELKTEPNKEECKRKQRELKTELERRRRQEKALRGYEKNHREELEKDLEAEPDEQRKQERREELEDDLIRNREDQRPVDEEMTLIDGEEHPAGFAQREILKRRVEDVLNIWGSVSGIDYLQRDEDRKKRLTELYEKKATAEEKNLSDQQKKEIDNDIASIKKEIEKEMLKVAAALSVKNLKKIREAINVFVDKKTKQEAPFNGEYEPVVLKWGGGEKDAWIRQVKDTLNLSLKRTATEKRNTKKWWEESNFGKKPYEIGIEPRKPSDKKMRNERVSREYLEKKAWADTRIEEYAQSQKIILKILERMDEKIRVSLAKDPEARNLSTLFKKHPEMGQDFLKIKEAVKFQYDIKESFRLEIAEQRRMQTFKNTLRQDLGDIVYRNFIDMFRSVSGPLGHILKGGGRFLVGKGGALISGKEVGSLIWQSLTAGVEFIGKEFFLSPARLLGKGLYGGGGAIEKKIRKDRKNEKIEEKIGKDLNT